MKTIIIQNATIVVDKIVGWMEIENVGYTDLIIYTLSENFEFSLGDDQRDRVLHELEMILREMKC